MEIFPVKRWTERGEFAAGTVVTQLRGRAGQVSAVKIIGSAVTEATWAVEDMRLMRHAAGSSEHAIDGVFSVSDIVGRTLDTAANLMWLHGLQPLARMQDDFLPSTLTSMGLRDTSIDAPVEAVETVRRALLEDEDNRRHDDYVV